MTTPDDYVTRVAKAWAENDQLWTTQEAVERSLILFAQVIFALAAQKAGESEESADDAVTAMIEDTLDGLDRLPICTHCHRRAGHAPLCPHNSEEDSE